MDKLYMLEVVTSLHSNRKPVAYSLETRKLKEIVVNAGSWFVGSDDVQNSPEVVAYTKNPSEADFPCYWIREVPFVI